jgi:hypothetical protein
MAHSIVGCHQIDEHQSHLPGQSHLPCQHKNNSNAPTRASKSAHALEMNVLSLIDRHGINHIGFLSLTFADPVMDMREAGRRFNSLRTGILQDRYEEYIAVAGRMKNGRIHFHLLVVLSNDIRTGIDFNRVAEGDYRTAGSALKDEWAFWGQTAPKYGFGRTEMLPIKRSSLVIARYMKKHLSARRPEDKGARLVRYSKDAKTVNTRFSWFCPRGIKWRKSLAILADRLRFKSSDDFRRMFGSRWAYLVRLHLERMELDNDLTMGCLRIRATLLFASQKALVATPISRGNGIPSRTARSPPTQVLTFQLPSTSP